MRKWYQKQGIQQFLELSVASKESKSIVYDSRLQISPWHAKLRLLSNLFQIWRLSNNSCYAIICSTNNWIRATICLFTNFVIYFVLKLTNLKSLPKWSVLSLLWMVLLKDKPANDPASLMMPTKLRSNPNG